MVATWGKLRVNRRYVLIGRLGAHGARMQCLNMCAGAAPAVDASRYAWKRGGKQQHNGRITRHAWEQRIGNVAKLLINVNPNRVIITSTVVIISIDIYLKVYGSEKR